MAAGDYPIPDCSRCPRPMTDYYTAQLSRPRQYKYRLVIEDATERRVLESNYAGDVIAMLKTEMGD